MNEDICRRGARVKSKKILEEHAWCFTNDGTRCSKYGQIIAVGLNTADGQNARLKEIEQGHKSGRGVVGRRPVGFASAI